MGVSTDGILCFGIDIGEEGETEVPWRSEEFDDLECWWRAQSGYKPSFNFYNEEGGYAEGVKSGDPRISEHYDEIREWDKNNPPPVEEVLHCSYDYPMYILAVKGTVFKANRGHPKEVATDWIYDPTPFNDFINKYGIEGQPKWLLCSLWG